ncbi:unnamed protein product [Caenorhabditis sp. 36 PRJEB53466]|nr:unnamed protein product [Caenorhabditis sp. 36 PRJEB53466]
MEREASRGILQLRHAFLQGIARTVVVAKAGNQILCILNCCHDAGWLHRDLKTDNILVERNQREVQLTTVDWGLSARFEKKWDALDDVIQVLYFLITLRNKHHLFIDFAIFHSRHHIEKKAKYKFDDILNSLKDVHRQLADVHIA